MLLCIVAKCIRCQSFIPSEIPFDGPEPRWQFEYEDPLFVKSTGDPVSTAYFGRLPIAQLPNGDDLYILESVLSQSPYGGWIGGFLYKVDMETGAIEWVVQRNLYTGLERRESYFGASLRLEGDTVSIYGGSNEELLDLTALDFIGYNIRPLILSFDSFSGQLLDSTVISQPEGTDFNTSPSKYIFHDDGGTSILGFPTLTVDTSFVFNYSLRSIELLSDTVLFYDTIYSKIDPPNEGPIVFNDVWAPRLAAFDESSLIVFSGETDFDDPDRAPSTLRMTRYNISNKDAAIVDLNVDLSSILYVDRERGSDLEVFTTNQKDMFLMQSTPRSDGNFAWWFRWLDRDGQLIASSDSVGSAERISFSRPTPIGRKNGYAYFYLYRPKSFEIYAVREGTSDLILVNQWVIPEEVEIRHNMQLPSLLPNGDLYMPIEHSEFWQEEWRQYLRHYYWDGDVLDLPTDVTDKEVKNIGIRAFPNPASDMLTVDTDIDTKLQVSLVSADSRHIIHSQISGNAEQIDVSHLPPGLYSLVVRSTDYFGSTEVLIVR